MLLDMIIVLLSQWVCISVNLFADYVLVNNYALTTRVMCDELAHWTCSAYVWALADWQSSWSSKRAMMIILCGFLDCCVDIDHIFIWPKAIQGTPMPVQTQRPLFHVTTFTILATVVLYLLTRNTAYSILPFMALAAWFPHQTRDANRRGYTLYPLPDTPPVSRQLYLFIITFVSPLAVGGLLYLSGHRWPRGSRTIVTI